MREGPDKWAVRIGIPHGNRKSSTCTVGCSKEPPTYSSIRKNRADALLRLLTQPFFAHSRVGC